MGTTWVFQRENFFFSVKKEIVQLLNQLLQMKISCRCYCAIFPAGVSRLHFPAWVGYRPSFQLSRLSCGAVTNNPQILVVYHNEGLLFTRATCPWGVGRGCSDSHSGTQLIEAPWICFREFPGRKKECGKSCIARKAFPWCDTNYSQSHFTGQKWEGHSHMYLEGVEN